MPALSWLARVLGIGVARDAGAPAAKGEAEPSPSQAEPDADPERAPDDDAPVVLRIEDSIDLHTFHPRDVPSVVEEYLYEARRLGMREVRVIHGRGKGVQRQIVQRVLASHPAVASFASAPASRGGWGATLVWLKD